MTQHGSDLEGKEKHGSMSAWEWGLGEIVHVNPARVCGDEFGEGLGAGRQVGLADTRGPLRGVVEEGNGTPFQYSCLENPMDGGPWWATVHGVAKSQTRLSDFTFTSHCYALEKEMATHSSVLAWRIPGMGEPGGLPSMRSHRVGHD